MADQPTVDGVTSLAGPPPLSGLGHEKEIQVWKKRLVMIGGVTYLLFILWAVFLLLSLPADGWEVLVPIGILTMVLGGIAFLVIAVVGFMHISQPTIPVSTRKRSLILLLIITIPGLALSAFVPYKITGEPPIQIDILSPRTSEEFVAPVQVTFGLDGALATLVNYNFTPIQYRWDINGDGKIDQETVTPRITVTFDREGVYNVRATLVDGAKNIRMATRTFIIQQSVFSILPNPVIVNRPEILSIANLVKEPGQLSEAQWDFDNDGKVDLTTKEPQVTYTFFRLGRTTASVKIILLNNTQVRYERSFEVIEPPTLPFPVKIISEPQYLISPAPFSTLWRLDTKEPIGQVLWDFGDGEKAEGERVAHTFDRQGNFVVDAKIFSRSGSSAQLSTIVQVVEQLNLSDLSFEGSPEVQGNRIEGEVPLALNLRPRTNTPFVQFFWEAPDATEVGSTETNLQAIYRREGTYNITIVAKNAENHVMRQVISVVVKPPSSALTIHMDPETGIAPLPVEFDASETFIPGETITGFQWMFGDQSPTQIGGARIKHTFEQEGTYTVGLTVQTTSGKQFQTSRTIAVRASSFTACVLPSRTSGTAPLGVQFTSSCSTGTVTSRLWDFGDASQSDEVDPIHVFEKPGVYTVTLTLENEAKRKVQETVTITVRP